MKKQASLQLTAAILEAVDNQLRDSNPPEAKETYDRLIASGISDKEARRLIAVALSSEMFQIQNTRRTIAKRGLLRLCKSSPRFLGISSVFHYQHLRTVRESRFPFQKHLE